MVLYHVKKSATNTIHGKILQVLKIYNYVGNHKKVITIRTPELKVLIINSDSRNEFSLDLDIATASNIKYMKGNLKIYEITDFVECQEMHIKSSMFPISFKDNKHVYMLYLSVFRHDQITNRTSYENTYWVLCCPNIYNLTTKRDGRSQHIIEVSRMTDTYKTDTKRFVNISEQVLYTKFIASMTNVVGRM